MNFSSFKCSSVDILYFDLSIYQTEVTFSLALMNFEVTSSWLCYCYVLEKLLVCGIPTSYFKMESIIHDRSTLYN